ncbi:hypothetical protein QRX25_01290 [Bacillus sp. L381]|jgi:hypothetical protein|uniref:YbyB n=1 Tax=Bacillus amyloliquefaciens (strain ATCC 23350 / DSM 7 / BCRC 11601 / CCUG 28519 / NBRC 15535 / NRRL B-14393 / F) TaxID=692420 RepID=A0A9P1JDJ3_BACAS|nr:MULTISPECIES: hypothetical protein [Bacillus]AEB61758.1 hypothetical protein LL3_00204 [Bacillus amyloliquefaciens LL3]AOC89761.1 uncharacterized protein BARD7_00256 [Bacillus amyloliquefaciens]ARW37371.1 uncharacterized protein S101267_00247 [Bacillus amyloliquefaciens]AZV91633.1 hypothetical protein BUN12_3381 [Bacillus amyloliquefaciens]KYC96934.1 hypothetical protein B425_0206 [Bacillus amyloliquefaciens]
MKQKLLISGLAVSTVGVTSYLLKDKSNRQKVKSFIRNMKTSLSGKHDIESFPVNKAGNPHPEDIEDNKMVSEGSMYPVQYYDDKKK